MLSNVAEIRVVICDPRVGDWLTRRDRLTSVHPLAVSGVHSHRNGLYPEQLRDRESVAAVDKQKLSVSSDIDGDLVNRSGMISQVTLRAVSLSADTVVQPVDRRTQRSRRTP